MKTIRVYADTSVFGGVYDEDFQEESKEFFDDALHVALATVSNCSLIVSWSFQHIVHFEKIPLYNAVNTLNGYPEIKIFSPLEVIRYEES